MDTQENTDNQLFYATVLMYEDGAFEIRKSDVKGLFIYVDSFDELITETRWVASHLLASNHDLDPDQIRDSVLHLKFYRVVEKESRQEPDYSDLFPSILLDNREIQRPLQLA